MNLYSNKKKDFSNEATLTELTKTPPMSAEQHALLMLERTRRRRQAETAREDKTEADKDIW